MSNKTSRTRNIYRDENLRALAMPLGGIGTGTIALCGDGSLRQWQIHNQVNHLGCVPHSFFAIWAHNSHTSVPPVARVLQSSKLYETEGPKPPPTSNDHLVPQAQRNLLKRLPGVANVEFVGEYPIAELNYYDPALPLDVHLEAFSPFIPLNSKESALPVILFNLTLTNATDHYFDATAAATLQNAVGWDGVTPIFENRCRAYGGNVNALLRWGEFTAIQMGTTRLSSDHAGYGSMVLGALSSDATYITQWNDLNAFWSDLIADGKLGNVADATPSPQGHTSNAALASACALNPGESRIISFMIAWYFPNRYVNYSQENLIDFDDSHSQFWIGNQYGRWFDSAFDVATYVQTNWTRLVNETRRARDVFYDTTLPPVLIDAVTSQMSIIRSPTCFWADDGRFYGFEGCGGASTPHIAEGVGGCCPLNCTHVWNYEMALARLFPDLERTMRETEWDLQQHPSGYLPHRVLLPTYLPRPWDRRIGGPDKPALDGLLGAILKTYREFRACGDHEWLARMWTHAKQALNYVWLTYDPGHAGVIEGEQPNTYDISIYGLNTFIGTLYLAALRACEEMARREGDEAFASECNAVYTRGRATLEQRLWNGEYYIQDVDLKKYPEQNWATGCHADQLLGQWWAHQLDLGYLLDEAHVRTAVQSIARYNWRDNFRGHKQKPRAFVTTEDEGLLLCTWPHGGRPLVPTLYSDEVWTGIEYEVAALLLYAGEVESAVRIVAATRRRYDGRKQNPWNEIECGDHYVRALSSWSLLEAASGYQYEADAAAIHFCPALTPDDFTVPFFARDGWGTFTQRLSNGVQIASIALAQGSVTINTLHLRWPESHPIRSITAARDSQFLSATGHLDDRDLRLQFSPPLTVSASHTVTVTLRA